MAGAIHIYQARSEFHSSPQCMKVHSQRMILTTTPNKCSPFECLDRQLRAEGVLRQSITLFLSWWNIPLQTTTYQLCPWMESIHWYSVPGLSLLPSIELQFYVPSDILSFQDNKVLAWELSQYCTALCLQCPPCGLLQAWPVSWDTVVYLAYTKELQTSSLLTQINHLSRLRLLHQNGVTWWHHTICLGRNPHPLHYHKYRSFLAAGGITCICWWLCLVLTWHLGFVPIQTKSMHCKDPVYAQCCHL